MVNPQVGSVRTRVQISPPPPIRKELWQENKEIQNATEGTQLSVVDIIVKVD